MKPVGEQAQPRWRECKDCGLGMIADGWVKCPRCKAALVVGEQAREPEHAEIAKALTFADEYRTEEYQAFMPWVNYPGGVARLTSLLAHFAIAYAAHCREAEQQEDASDYFDLLRRAEAAEASLRSAKADECRYWASKIDVTEALIRTKDMKEVLLERAAALSVPSAPTASNEEK